MADVAATQRAVQVVGLAAEMQIAFGVFH